ncbi:MAG: hypothetical protein ACFHHU_08520 [Porticoccaceae bacterium]
MCGTQGAKTRTAVFSASRSTASPCPEERSAWRLTSLISSMTAAIAVLKVWQAAVVVADLADGFVGLSA